MAELDGLDEGFADVLDLADWQAIISQYEAGLDDDGADLDPDIANHLTGTFKLTVSFDSRENADKAAPGILDMPGVVNVANSGR
jgi:hypothetical protein